METLKDAVLKISNEISNYNKERSKTITPSFIITAFTLLLASISIFATIYTINNNIEKQKLEMTLEALKSVSKLVELQSNETGITHERLVVFELFKEFTKGAKEPELAVFNLILADEYFYQSFYTKALDSYGVVVGSKFSTENMKELAFREMGMIYYLKLDQKDKAAESYSNAMALSVPDNHKSKTKDLWDSSLMKNKEKY